MTYKISGLEPSQFAHLVGLSDEELAAHGAVRMTADGSPASRAASRWTMPSRARRCCWSIIAQHDGDNPYRATHAIFVSESATEAAVYEDEIPPALDRPHPVAAGVRRGRE